MENRQMDYVKDMNRRKNRVSAEAQKEIRKIIWSFKSHEEKNESLQDLFKGLTDIEQLLLSYDYGYKFSKSCEEIKKLFTEDFYIPYVEKSIVRAEDYPLSFIVDKNKLGGFMDYGDQLTRISLDKYIQRY